MNMIYTEAVGVSVKISYMILEVRSYAVRLLACLTLLRRNSSLFRPLMWPFLRPSLNARAALDIQVILLTAIAV